MQPSTIFAIEDYIMGLMTWGFAMGLVATLPILYFYERREENAGG